MTAHPIRTALVTRRRRRSRRDRRKCGKPTHDSVKARRRVFVHRPIDESNRRRIVSLARNKTIESQAERNFPGAAVARQAETNETSRQHTKARRLRLLFVALPYFEHRARRGLHTQTDVRQQIRGPPRANICIATLPKPDRLLKKEANGSTRSQ